MNRFARMFLIASIILTTWGTVSGADPPGRRVICLDGTWQIAEGTMDQVPDGFEHQVPVPGLADMAEPAFEAVGTEESKQHREAFWYRRTFSLDGPAPEFARLKIHKAKFGTRVFLNGRLVGDHLPCFTPAVLDVTGALKAEGQTNELVIRVGAWRDAVPKTMPDGWDFEKVRYIPGVYDSVELILSGTPHVVRVQTVPEVAEQAVRVVTVLESTGRQSGTVLKCRVREAATGEVVGSTQSDPLEIELGAERTVELRIPIENCRLWSPEDPFLYELEASTGADTYRTRFGMRSFRFDPKTGMGVLNGKPYPMRGTNVCIYRFFEDPARGDRPWREEWVRRLHRLFRGMHWNAIRYCIGFPPEAWYRIADEEGLLIQDEFPIWYLGQWPKELASEQLIEEYTEWIEERWNHPCVVIWDAQNESRTDETGKAIQAVRGLDLSGRPWDNGWSEPQAPGDSFEAHPYPFYSAKGSGRATSFRLSGFAGAPGAPGVPGGMGGNALPNRGKNPVIINEYGWLWLNRDGTPTTLSAANYAAFLEPEATICARRGLYARYLAAMTEFWRSHRQVAGVLHFCGLGYARAGGETSDHFLDLEKLTLEPFFECYVRDAFAPVGLMIDHWDEQRPPQRELRVAVINDRDTAWEGTLNLTVRRPGRDELTASRPCKVEPLGREVVSFPIEPLSDPGRYRLEAELIAPGGPPVRSVREFTILTDDERKARDGIGQGKPVEASSSVTVDGETYPAAHAVDGNPRTRWSSEFSDPQWIAVDLGEVVTVSRVELHWEAACGKAYTIQVSEDGTTWRDVFTTDSGDGGVDRIRFTPTQARWVRMYGTKRGTAFGYSLWEMKIFP